MPCPLYIGLWGLMRGLYGMSTINRAVGPVYTMSTI